MNGDGYKLRENAVIRLHEGMMGEDREELLWSAIAAFEGCEFHTASGLPFTYNVKRNKIGEPGGELIVSRKEGSKTLTRSSVMFAFSKVYENGTESGTFTPPEYGGPKAIGQIFGISYIYSMFHAFGIITVPEKVERKLLQVTWEDKSTGVP